MNQQIFSLGLLGVLACSGGAGSGGARAATPIARTRAPEAIAKAAEPVAKPGAREDAAAASPEYHDEGNRDLVFVENAERAIREYTEFITRAGDSEEYAQAVRRSREQIEDLRDTLVFVREASKQP